MMIPAGPGDNRPPNKPPVDPPPPPPPPPPTHPPKVGHLPPARQIPTVAAAAGGPGQTTRPTSGEERTPRSAAAPATAAREGEIPGASFRTPQPPGPPRFAEGEHRLGDSVGPPAEAEAAVIASLIVAAATARKP